MLGVRVRVLGGLEIEASTIRTFDCLHDLGDPLADARRFRQVICRDGTWLLIEPFAGDTLEKTSTR